METLISENRPSKKALYLPTDNTCEKSERGYCSWGCDEDKPLSEFQKTFSCGQKMILKLTAKQSCTGHFVTAVS